MVAKKPKKKLGRPKAFVKDVVVSLRLDRQQYDLLKEIAAVETSYSDKIITAVELIRMAIAFTFEDNERLRECFVRARVRSARGWANRNL